MPWLLVALQVCIAVYLVVSYMLYNIVQALVSSYTAVLIRKVLGYSRLM
jgi:hypothetical protein